MSRRSLEETLLHLDIENALLVLSNASVKLLGKMEQQSIDELLAEISAMLLPDAEEETPDAD